MAEKCTFNPKYRKRARIIDALLALILVGFSIFTILNYNSFNSEISQDILLYGEIGLAISVFLLELIPSILNPYLPMIIFMASGGDILNSLIIVSIASVLGCLVGFEIGRKYGWQLICPLFEEKVINKILIFWQKYGKFFVALSAITPLPYFPLVFGTLGLSRRDMWIFGIIPRLLSFVILGYGFYLGSIYT
jgi:uncharacterized membrane protein YdjX (TVP38/TMEM64 family)